MSREKRHQLTFDLGNPIQLSQRPVLIEGKRYGWKDAW